MKIPPRINRLSIGTLCAGFAAILGLAADLSAQRLREREPEPADPLHPEWIYSPVEARLIGLESLRIAVQKDKGVPLPADLDNYVRDREAAIQLGKALFWDMQVGSDGVQSCATCHFHAGADTRSRNQLSPGLLRILGPRDGDIKGHSGATNAPDLRFDAGAANYKLTAKDFPFVKTPDKWVTNDDGTLAPWPGNSHDTVSSAGVCLSMFEGISPTGRADRATAVHDPVWNVAGVTGRRVEPRNAPSVINAIFNFAQFWDGRANPNFNGVNPFGDQDLAAKVFVTQGSSKTLLPVKVSMRNASLASQSVGPPLSFFEMSFGNGAENFRIFPEIGRKLLSRNPLALQRVSPSDSVLGKLARRSGKGLDPDKFRDETGKNRINGYRYLIQKAFRPEYWDSPEVVILPGPVQAEAPGNQSAVQAGPAILARAQAAGNGSFSQMEANMAFFFGVSVMLYESTLVSDQTPFDRWMERGGYVNGFGQAELNGLNVFITEGKCINCHGGPEFTNASVRNAQGGRNMIEPMLMGEGAALYDNGFYNIAVTLTSDDLGRGGNDPFGRPLAFARQALFKRFGIQDIPFPIIGDPFPVRDEEGTITAGRDRNGNGLVDADEALLIPRVAVDGSFKTPGLRNVELTGPYFHNGGTATLMQVVQFYNRGGNFSQYNAHDLAPDITQLRLRPDQERDLVKFMVSLTDPRVKFKRAPFDHPELFIPNGHPGNHVKISRTRRVGDIEQGADNFLHLPAVGREGTSKALKPFLDLDPQLGEPVVTGSPAPPSAPAPPDPATVTQLTP